MLRGKPFNHFQGLQCVILGMMTTLSGKCQLVQEKMEALQCYSATVRFWHLNTIKILLERERVQFGHYQLPIFNCNAVTNCVLCTVSPRAITYASDNL